MSAKPSKVRKQFYMAPLQARSARIRAPLSQELKTKYRINAVRVREGDSAKVTRGEYEGVEGKVTAVYTDTGRVAVEGITREKIKGGTVPVRIHASKVMITGLNLDDKLRKQKLEALAGGSA